MQDLAKRIAADLAEAVHQIPEETSLDARLEIVGAYADTISALHRLTQISQRHAQAQAVPETITVDAAERRDGPSREDLLWDDWVKTGNASQSARNLAHLGYSPGSAAEALAKMGEERYPEAFAARRGENLTYKHAHLVDALKAEEATSS